MHIAEACIILCSMIMAIYGNLTEDLKSNGLTTLLELIGKAGLEETLKSVELATIFAPTNEAFESIPEDVLDNLVNDKQLLKNTLLSHVIPNSAIKFEDLKGNDQVNAAGGPLRIRTFGIIGRVVNGIKVQQVNVMAESGSSIHTVDGVLPLVKESDNIAAVLSSNSQFSTLSAAIKTAGLTNNISSTDDITLFAPTNDAFARIPEDKLEAILADKDQLTAILTRHVVPKVIFTKVAPKKSHRTLNPKAKLRTGIDSWYGILRVTTFPGNKAANIVRGLVDINASNGVIHAIGKVV